VTLLLVVFCLLFFGAVLLLVTVNNAPVDVNLLFRSFHQVSLSLVIVISVLGGIVFASILGILDGIRLRLQNRRLRKLLASVGTKPGAVRIPALPVREGDSPLETPIDRLAGD
jgi:uncharacterized integral membrane protein